MFLKNRFSGVFQSAVFAIIGVAVLGYADDSVQRSDSALNAEMMSMYREYREEAYPDAPEIRVQEFNSLRTEAKTVLVDVREKKEYAVSIIPGAITQKEFERRKKRFRGYQIVVYCTIGYRSGEYTEMLIEDGYEAFNMVGGVLAWAHDGFSFTRQGEQSNTNRVHVYGKKWNLVPEGYEAVW